MFKNYKYYVALLIPVLAACESDDVQFHIESPEDQMHITASEEDIVLTPADADKDMLTFTWNLPANRGEGSEITSYFRMDLEGNLFETATELIELAPDQTSITFTGDDLNDFLLGWGISPNTKVKVEAEIVATVNNETTFYKPEITKTSLLLTGYAAVSRDFFVNNTANDGWYDNQMNEIVLGKQYSITGWFDKNVPVKFAFDLNNPEVTYTKGADNNSLVRTSGNGGEGFTVPETGYYSVRVNLKTLAVTWSPISKKFNDLDNLWVVGNSVPCGWDIVNPLPMTREATASHIWTWEGILSPGELKCPLGTGSWGVDFVRPLTANVSEMGDDNIDIYLNPDNKWLLTCNGHYIIGINTWLGKVKFTEVK